MFGIILDSYHLLFIQKWTHFWSKIVALWLSYFSEDLSVFLLILLQLRVVSQTGLFRSGSGLKLTKILGLIRAWNVIFVLNAQKYDQNYWAT